MNVWYGDKIKTLASPVEWLEETMGKLVLDNHVINLG
jgi:hypothetical protein